MKSLTIGKLAEAAGVNLQTIRYYEKRGLIPPPARRPSGYRQYAESDVGRILFIKQAKNLGFSLDEISDLLSLRLDPVTSCKDVRRMAIAKIADLEQKITALQRIKEVLIKLVSSCESRRSNSECPILDSLEDGKNIIERYREDSK